MQIKFISGIILVISLHIHQGMSQIAALRSLWTYKIYKIFQFNSFAAFYMGAKRGTNRFILNMRIISKCSKKKPQFYDLMLWKRVKTYYTTLFGPGPSRNCCKKWKAFHRKTAKPSFDRLFSLLFFPYFETQKCRRSYNTIGIQRLVWRVVMSYFLWFCGLNYDFEYEVA